MNYKTILITSFLGISLGWTIEYLYNQNELKSELENIACYSNETSYYIDNDSIVKFHGVYQIKLAKDNGIIQAVGKLSVNDDVYNVYRRVKIQQELTGNNILHLKHEKQIPVQRYDDVPEDIEKKYLFEIYYKENAEANYEIYTINNNKWFLFKQSVIPRFLCTKG